MTTTKSLYIVLSFILCKYMQTLIKSLISFYTVVNVCILGTGPSLRLISHCRPVYHFLEVICRRQTSQGQLYGTQNDLCIKLMDIAFLKLCGSLMLENGGFLLDYRQLVLIIQPCIIFSTPIMTSL